MIIRIECILLKLHWGMKALIELHFQHEVLIELHFQHEVLIELHFQHEVLIELHFQHEALPRFIENVLQSSLSYPNETSKECIQFLNIPNLYPL